MERWQIILITVLIPVLILVFVGVYLASKFWEIYCKICSQMEPTNFRTRKGKSPDRGFIPKFTDKSRLPQDLSQMYYYHDNIWHRKLPNSLLAKFALRDNGCHAPPNAIAFEPEPGRLFMIFRSTKTNFEISQNLRICQKKIHDFGHVHRGVARMYAELRVPVLCFLEKNYEKYSEIVVFGHSLGGAFVNILSVELQKDHSEIWSRVTAFSSGSPKVLDPKTVKDFEELDTAGGGRLTQVVNDADIIVHQPLCATTECDKVYYYKSFRKRVLAFNRVVRGRAMDSHVTSLYSKTLWKPCDSIGLYMNF